MAPTQDLRELAQEVERTYLAFSAVQGQGVTHLRRRLSPDDYKRAYKRYRAEYRRRDQYFSRAYGHWRDAARANGFVVPNFRGNTRPWAAFLDGIPTPPQNSIRTPTLSNERRNEIMNWTQTLPSDSATTADQTANPTPTTEQSAVGLYPTQDLDPDTTAVGTSQPTGGVWPSGNEAYPSPPPDDAMRTGFAALSLEDTTTPQDFTAPAGTSQPTEGVCPPDNENYTAPPLDDTMEDLLADVWTMEDINALNATFEDLLSGVDSQPTGGELMGEYPPQDENTWEFLDRQNRD